MAHVALILPVGHSNISSSALRRCGPDVNHFTAVREIVYVVMLSCGLISLPKHDQTTIGVNRNTFVSGMYLIYSEEGASGFHICTFVSVEKDGFISSPMRIERLYL